MNDLVKIENNEIIVKEEIINQIVDFQKVKEKMDMIEKELKASLKDAMELKGIEKFVINGLCATIRKATTRKSVDTTRLKQELPDVYEEYLKESPVASSITLTYSE